MWIKLLVGAVVVVAAAFGARTVIRGLVSEPRVFREAPATEFLERYVDDDGRKPRRVPPSAGSSGSGALT